jgi:hypothetical protein
MKLVPVMAVSGGFSEGSRDWSRDRYRTRTNLS